MHVCVLSIEKTHKKSSNLKKVFFLSILLLFISWSLGEMGVIQNLTCVTFHKPKFGHVS